MSVSRLRVALLTVGDPATLTGGYLYHRRMAALARRNNAVVRFVSFPERPFPLAIFDAPGVFRRLRGLRPDVVALDSIAAAFAAPWLALRGLDLPLVGVLHQPPGGIDYDLLRTGVQARLDMLAYRKADRLLLASESLRKRMAALGVPHYKMRVAPPGRDVAAASAPLPKDLRRGRRAAFLCVGNWVVRKGIRSLLEAFALLPPELATLHLAGDDSVDLGYTSALKMRLARPDLRDRVVVHGPLPVEEVAALYSASDVFVLPSVKEPYGTVYGEAMAAGLPVVGWRAGNLPYLADDGREGLLAAPGDIQGLADILEKLALDETLRRRLGEAARCRAMSLPTWEGSAVLFFEGLRQAVTSYGPSARPRARL